MKRFIVRIGLGIVMGGLLWGGLSANQARATDLTFSFTGAVGFVNQSLFPTLNAGQTLSGSFNFNPATLDSEGSSTLGVYTGAITGLTVNLGPFSGSLGSASSINPNAIIIVNDSSDSYSVRAPLSGSGGPFPPFSFALDLAGPSTLFGSDALPTTPPSLSNLFSNEYRISFLAGGFPAVSGVLTSIVPLPTAVILFGAGLIALVGLGAGSWRKRNSSLA